MSDFLVPGNYTRIDNSKAVPPISIPFQYRKGKQLDDYLYTLRLEAENASRHKVTANGDAQLDGDKACLFYGTGDYLTVPYSSDWDIGSSDYSIEVYVKANALGGVDDFIISQQTTNSGIRFDLEADDRFLVAWYFSGGTVSLYSSAITDNDWHHVETCRNGSDVYLFVDGVLEDSGTVSGSFIGNTNDLLIGRFNSGNPLEFNGKLSRLQISKGIARNTTGFTPPARTSDIVDDDFTVLALNFEGDKIVASDGFSNTGQDSGGVGDRWYDARWDDTVAAGGSISISGGVMSMSVTNTQTDATYNVNKALLVGDGTISVDYSNLVLPGNQCEIGLRIDDSSGFVAIVGRYWNNTQGGNRIFSFDLTNGIQEIDSQPTSGTLTVTRSSGTITLKHGDSTLATLTDSDDLTARLAINAQSYPGSPVSVDWDNFTITPTTYVPNTRIIDSAKPDNGGLVGFCPDVSGNENDGTPNNVTYDATIPAYIFNNTDSFIALANAIAIDQYVFGVAEPDHAADVGVLYFCGDKDSDSEYTYLGYNNNLVRCEARTLAEGIDSIQSTTDDFTLQVVTALLKESDRQIWRDSVLLDSTTATRARNSWDKTEIGRLGRLTKGDYYNGKVAGLYVVTPENVGANRENIEQLLADKFGII